MATIFKEVNISVNLNKNIFIEVPEEMSDEEIIEEAKTIIPLPDKLLRDLNQVLSQFNVKVSITNNSDITDWKSDNPIYKIL
jgi:hypothetical protein